jgi:phosphopantetheinyl transferase
MPLFYQQDINETTRLAVWKIEEEEDFFLAKVPLQMNITHPNKRLQHLAGRYLLQYLFPDFPYDELLIADTRKPFLPNEQYHFSISHCGEHAAAIVSRSHRVGIDIEVPNERIAKIRHKFLHEEERKQFNVEEATEAISNIDMLATLWCAKEAMYKWWGNGSVDFSEMLRIENVSSKEDGLIDALFIHNRMKVPLQLHYQDMVAVYMVWVES